MEAQGPRLVDNASPPPPQHSLHVIADDTRQLCGRQGRKRLHIPDSRRGKERVHLVVQSPEPLQPCLNLGQQLGARTASFFGPPARLEKLLEQLLHSPGVAPWGASLYVRR